jgi:hypothetical protein
MMSHAPDEMSDPASFAGLMVSIWLMNAVRGAASTE